MLSLALVTFASLVTSSQATPVAEVESTKAPQKFWFSFGDSYTQTWFNVTGDQPNAQNPLGNPIFPGYTACGLVPNWVDYSVGTYNSSLVLTYNYAYGGATIDANLVTPWQPTVKSLIDQVHEFGNYTAKGKPFYPGYTSANSIFAFWIGINDIGNSWWLEGDRAAFSDLLLERYFEQVRKVYNAGARNFLFLNVPPVYLSPLMLAQPPESREGEKVVLDGFNQKLWAKAKSFERSLPGVKVYRYDTDAILKTILANPTAYGLKDATSYGPGDATDVAWCNDYHISDPVHKEVAKGVAALLGKRFL